MPENTATNPYDFRSPVRHVHLLAGRSGELDHINELLRAAAAGRPPHLSLFGPSGCGKSSLLNGVAEIARSRALLPIHLTLREATVATELAFYGAVFDAGLQALVQAGLLDESDPMLQGWIQQTRGGNLALPHDHPQLEIGLLAAASLAGRHIVDIPIVGLQRDLARLLSLGETANLRGVALCLDAAEYIDDNRDVAQSLSVLASTTSILTLVTASETAGKLQGVAPRSWDQLEVKPLAGTSAVFEAMTRPLEFAEERGMTPDFATARDVYALTGGHPYEVNLVCHFMWEGVRAGEQASFGLSPSMIERLLAELEKKGRHESSVAISVLSDLTSAEYEVLARLAPYEALTVKQMALVQLMLEDFSDERLTEAEDSIRIDLRSLKERGVLSLEAGRPF